MNKLKDKKKGPANPEYPPKKEKKEVHTKRYSNNSSIINSSGYNNSGSNSNCNIGNSFVRASENGTAGEDNIINKIKELNLVLLQNKDEIGSLRQENEAFSSQIANFVKKCKELQCMCSERETDIAKLKQNEKCLVQEINKRKKEKGQLEDKMKKLEQEGTSKSEHISQVECERDNLTKELQKRDKQINFLHENIKQLEGQITLLRNENAKNKQDVTNNLKKQNEINEHINSKDSKIAALEEKTQKLNKVVRDKTEENENCKKKIQQQSAKIAHLNDKIQMLEKDQKIDKEKIKKYIDNIKSLKKNNQKMDERSRESQMEEQRKELEDVIFNSQVYKLSKKMGTPKKSANSSSISKMANSVKNAKNTNGGGTHPLLSPNKRGDKHPLNSDSSASSSCGGSSDGEIVSFSTKYNLSKNVSKGADTTGKKKK
ncbi:conserved Plasmodium protein, unknown function [Plasmodium vivax]|uniref:Protein MGET n=5 Tax=Plasmodium vivax TaxID=5855 RepID=A5K358_PLAVS|nr:hypothetical protein, conserved [Plasmodium vivax]KMZ78653.1 hypothetical protein PVIIG_00048 [Plasmodium vivax India VII]KMZ85043.1 hypothetical protein PVBG_01442 [Plasmodium vivax Brazil I]KMZ98019.1 hypothetical protein PVNG_00357 [Plasmodium vivax North Korean]EDL45962.1 hypothetical protein, conserved [Plasmodium vivax]CAI7722181.1 protein MGET, putative [Plasmodium vivax]|eukprot:XP_001615689.1 hypothetical protein [Plasmodium vivax Sal-1]